MLPFPNTQKSRPTWQKYQNEIHFYGTHVKYFENTFFLNKSMRQSGYWLAILSFKYSWFSLSRTLDISTFALSWIIYLVPWSFSTWSKQKTLGILNLDISNFCLCWTNYPVAWTVFSCYLERFSKFAKPFLQFFSQISLFSTPASTIAAIVPTRTIKDSQINFFLFLFWLNVLTRCFYH